MTAIEPKVRTRYADADGRILLVRTISPGDSKGREVQGLVYDVGEEGGKPYSCTLQTWAHVWLDGRAAKKGTLNSYDG